MSHLQNITRIKAVYDALEELSILVVFVGGATVSLYKDRPAGDVRPTDDVDILVELINYSGYAAIEAILRKKGFHNDTESGVICRYRVNGIIVDVMPTNDSILGFSNAWYPDGFSNAVTIKLDEDCNIKIFSSPYFIATKLEAFKSRGKNDGRTSSDFEDIVYVLNNRTTVWDEFRAAPKKLKIYLQTQFRLLLENEYLDEWISSNLDFSEQRRVVYIIGGLREFIEA